MNVTTAWQERTSTPLSGTKTNRSSTGHHQKHSQDDDNHVDGDGHNDDHQVVQLPAGVLQVNSDDIYDDIVDHNDDQVVQRPAGVLQVNIKNIFMMIIITRRVI